MVPILFTAHSIGPCRTIQTPALPTSSVPTPAEREKIFWPVADPAINLDPYPVDGRPRLASSPSRH